MAKKAHNSIHIRTDNRWSGTTTEVTVNSGKSGVGVSLRYSHEVDGVNASLTPDQARKLGQDLIERANEIQG